MRAQLIYTTRKPSLVVAVKCYESAGFCEGNYVACSRVPHIIIECAYSTRILKCQMKSGESRCTLNTSCISLKCHLPGEWRVHSLDAEKHVIIIFNIVLLLQARV